MTHMCSAAPPSKKLRPSFSNTDAMREYNWDTLRHLATFNHHQLAMALFESLPAYQRIIGVSSSASVKFQHFLHRVLHGYKPSLAYHSADHALDVLVTVHALIHSLPQLNVSDYELLAVYVGAVCHDLGHDGWNNKVVAERADDLGLSMASDGAWMPMNASLLASPLETVCDICQQSMTLCL